uniref:Uncharacterized protein n=1 Tax=Lepeophtheirus salmonis TaxID=72036 RepID=A0A0K2U8V4_LEPSM
MDNFKKNHSSWLLC